MSYKSLLFGAILLLAAQYVAAEDSIFIFIFVPFFVVFGIALVFIIVNVSRYHCNENRDVVAARPEAPYIQPIIAPNYAALPQQQGQIMFSNGSLPGQVQMQSMMPPGQYPMSGQGYGYPQSMQQPQMLQPNLAQFVSANAVSSNDGAIYGQISSIPVVVATTTV